MTLPSPISAYKPEIVWQNSQLRVIHSWDPDEQRGFLTVELRDGVDAMGVARWVDAMENLGQDDTSTRVILELATALHEAGKVYSKLVASIEETYKIFEDSYAKE